MSNTENWVEVADRNDLKVGEVIGVKVGDLDIALYDVDGQIFATNNVCTHADALLSNGWLDGEIIECPLHGGRFEVRTGKGLGPPIVCDLKTFSVRVDGGKISVRLA